jgi:drug/metabolite transporter (DMT)-like permease
MPKKELTALLLALLACLIWSGNFVIARGAHDFIMPVTLSFWRWLVALVVIIPIGYKHVRKQWPSIKKHWKYFTFMGVFGVALFNTLVYSAGHYTSAHHIALISATAPIWTLLMAGMLGHDKFSRYKVMGALCAFLGALVIISHGKLQFLLDEKWNTGDLILVFSAFLWAVYCVALHYKPKQVTTKSFLTVIIAIGTAALLPFYIWEATTVAPTPFTIEAWSIYLYVGIASSVIAWFAWNHSVHTIGSVKTGLVYYTIPIFSSILAIFLLHEPLANYHFVGFVFVFLGIVLSNLKKVVWVRG